MPIDALTPAIRILVGGLLLILGRKLFWIFVGAIGFLFGFNLASQYLSAQPDWVILLVAVLAGIIGAGLAVFVQRAAVVVAGFLAGGYLTLQLLAQLGIGAQPAPGDFAWLPFIVGGIVGALLLSVLFDWALIFLSSLAGANLITQAVNPDANVFTLIFVGLLLIGVLVQAGLMRSEQPTTAE
jgi:hypothetical protein